MQMKHLLAAMGITAALASTAASAVDAGLPEYKKVDGIAGNLSSVGSDTLANLMTFWNEEFKCFYPNVTIQIQAAGSSTASPALTEGTAQFGPMSRPMKDNELQEFEKRHGYKPTEIRVAIDALAIYVHQDNPITGLSMQQLDAIFSSTRVCGAVADVKSWADLGLEGEWARRDLQLFGRNSVSGTYGYFKEHALCKGDFKNNVNEQPGSAAVVQAVSSSLNAIGYSGIGYITAGVKKLPLSVEGDDYVEASAENAISGDYPLSRYLLVYVNKHPNQPLPPVQAEFIKLMLSETGQKIVEKDGYIPLPKAVIERELAKLGL